MSLRVLIVSHLWPRADLPHLGVFVADQVAELARSCTVTVVSPVDSTHRSEELTLRELSSGRPKFQARSRPQFLSWGGVEAQMISFRARFFRAAFAASTARSLADSLARMDLSPFDLVHAHTLFPDGLACAYWLQDSPVPLVVTAHGSDVHSMPHGVRKALRALLQRSDQIIAVSQSLAAMLAKLGADPARLTVLPNGFSADLFDLKSAPGRDERKIVFLGRLGAIKRVDLLIRALALCPAEVHLEIAGDGAERPRLEALVQSLGLDKRIRFLGMIPREGIPKFLASAGLLCIVSEKEGWPTVIFESLACGTPVLATAVGGIPEALSRPGLGMLVPPDISAERLAEAIQAALHRSWDHAAIREHALGFSWSSLCAKLTGIYETVCKLKSRPEEAS